MTSEKMSSTSLDRGESDSDFQTSRQLIATTANLGLGIAVDLREESMGKDLKRYVSNLIRRNPAKALGAGFAAGFMVGRQFLSRDPEDANV